MPYWKPEVYIPDEALTKALTIHFNDLYISGVIWKTDVSEPEIASALLTHKKMYTWLHTRDHYVAIVLEMIEGKLHVTLYDSLAHTDRSTYLSKIEKIVTKLGFFGAKYKFIHTTEQTEVECGICTLNNLLDAAGISHRYTRKSLWNLNYPDK